MSTKKLQILGNLGAEVDSTLTQSGKAADAKVTGDALSTLNALVGDKAVSEQINTAIASKSDVGHTHTASEIGADASGAAASALTSAKSYTDTKIANLVNGAPTTLDTLGEIATAMANNEDVVEALESAIGTKANASDLTSHTGNKSNPHGVTLSQLGVNATATELNYVDGVTSAIQTQLNAKVPTSRTVNGKALSSNITLSASDVGADSSGSANTALTNAKAYTDAEITEWVGDKTVAAQISSAIENKVDKVSGKGLSTNDYTTTEKDKLAGIATGAEVNQNAFSTIKVGSTEVKADSKTDTLTLVAGSNVTITPDATNDKVTIAATDTVYTHPSYTAKSAGLYKVTVDSTGHVSAATAVAKSDITGLGIPAQDTTYSAATTSAAGLMSAADKTTLNNLSTLVGDTKVSEQIASATNNVVKVDPNDTAISGTATLANAGTFNGMTYAQVKADILNSVVVDEDGQTGVYSVNGKSGNVLLSASDVGAAESGHNHDGVYASATTLNTLVGDTKVSDQIASAISGIVHPVTSVCGATGAVRLINQSLSTTNVSDLNEVVSSNNMTHMTRADVGCANMPTAYTGNAGCSVNYGYGDAWSGQLFFGFTGQAFIRNKSTGDWSTWYQLYSEKNKPTYSDVGAAAASHTHTALSSGAARIDGVFESDTVTGVRFVNNSGNSLGVIRLVGSNSGTDTGFNDLQLINPAYNDIRTVYHTGNLSFSLSGSTLTITKS